MKASPNPLKQQSLKVVVDGETVTIEGQKEVVIKCGAAQIILRNSGEVLINGINVLSSAKKTNALRGGSVKLN